MSGTNEYFLTTYYIWQKHTKEPNTKHEPEPEHEHEPEPKHEDIDIENKNEAALQPKLTRQKCQLFC